MPDDKDLSPAERARKLFERDTQYWRPIHEAYAQKRAFLAGDRYVDNSDWANRDKRLTQIHGNETFDTIRHIAAEATAKPRNLQARPIDKSGEDGMSGEIMVSLVENELNNPWKAFDRYYYEAVLSARTASLGVVWMDWEKDFGAFGEVFFIFESPENIMWDPSYDPHHPLCGHLFRSRRMDVDEARKKYGAPWLEPDRSQAKGGRSAGDTPLLQGASRPMAQVVDDDKVTISECWYKNDTTKKYRENGRAKMLPKGQRYLSCVSGCGYRSPTQEDLSEGGQPQELPEYLEQACQKCGGDLDRIDSYAEQETVYAYSRGKRQVVLSPYCAGSEDGLLYDGAWPVPKARSFPGLFLVAYVSPGEPVGPSDVTLAWDQQIASDQLRTLALQRVFEHRGIWVISRDGIVDNNGRRFENRDDQNNIAFKDTSNASAFGVPTIEHINATGLDPSFGLVFQVQQQALTQYRGTTDLGLTPESSKNIAVGTVEQMVQQGNIPTADFTKRNSAELAKFCGVLSDYISATYTPKRITRLNIEGSEILANIWGDDLPNFDFVIEDNPPWTGTEKAQVEALKFLEQVAQRAPHLVPVYAKRMNLPPSVVREFEEATATAKDEAKQMQAQQLATEEGEMEQDVDAELEAAEMGMDPESMALEASGLGMQGPAQ